MLLALLLPLGACVDFMGAAPASTTNGAAQNSPVDTPTGQDAEDAAIDSASIRGSSRRMAGSIPIRPPKS